MSLIFGIVAVICILLTIVICVLIHFDKVDVDIGVVIILVLVIIFVLSGVFCACSDFQNSTGNTPSRWYYWLPTDPYGGGIVIPMN